jgi:hypothetical protein
VSRRCPGPFDSGSRRGGANLREQVRLVTFEERILAAFSWNQCTHGQDRKVREASLPKDRGRRCEMNNRTLQFHNLHLLKRPEGLLSRLAFSMAYDSLVQRRFRDDLRKIFKTFDCSKRAMASIFRRIPFGTACQPAPLPIFRDHNPISSETSASVHKPSPPGRKTGISEKCSENLLRAWRLKW